jgi:hypothetical protein
MPEKASETNSFFFIVHCIKKRSLTNLCIDLIKAIKQGDIVLAFELIKTHFPALAAHDLIPNGIPPPNDSLAADLQDILVQLRCQCFIEIIRTSSSTLEAIRYAQTHLRATNSTAKERVKEVTALIAYADPHQSQSSHLLSQQRRDDLAATVNDAILGIYIKKTRISNMLNSCIIIASSHLPVQTSIEKICRQYAAVADELEKSNNDSLPIKSYREKMAI